VPLFYWLLFLKVRNASSASSITNIFGLYKRFSFWNVDDVFTEYEHCMACAILPFLESKPKKNGF